MKSIALIVFTMTLAGGLSGAAAESSAERGRRVVNEALAALGGDKYLAMENRVESGRAYSFYRDKLSGLSIATFYDRYLSGVAPGTVGLEERQSFGKDGKNGGVLLKPDAGYQISFRGARPVDPKLLDRFRTTLLHNVFYILRMRLKEPGLIIESKGADVLDNAPVELVEITDADNRVVTVAFHRTTKLPVQQVFYRRDPETRDRIEEKTYYNKYRDVGDGVMWPYSIVRERNGEKIFEQYSDSVKVNQELKPALFSLSPDEKVLPPAK
jgi:hypothetical protein